MNQIKKKLRIKVWKKFNCKCAYCGDKLEYDKMQVDHIKSKYSGGKDVFENYNPSCRSCNFYKSTFTVDEFRNQLQTIIDRIKKPFIVRLAIKYNIISFKKFDGIFHYEKYNNTSEINCSNCKYDKDNPRFFPCSNCHFYNKHES